MEYILENGIKELDMEEEGLGERMVHYMKDNS
jgi:hypothetical protein